MAKIINSYTYVNENGETIDVLVYKDGTSQEINTSSGQLTFVGTDGDDHIVGSSGDDIIYGYGGDDMLISGNGDDFIDGGSGSDIVLAGQGSDTVFHSLVENLDNQLSGGFDYYNGGMSSTSSGSSDTFILDLSGSAFNTNQAFIDEVSAYFEANKDGLVDFSQLSTQEFQFNVLLRGFQTIQIETAVVAVNDSGETDQNSLLTVSAADGLLANDIDLDQNVLSVESADSMSALGLLVSVAADGSYTYDPGSTFISLGLGETAIDSFNYTVIDEQGHTSTAEASITINGLDDEATANVVSSELTQDDGLVSLGLVSLSNLNDPDANDVVSVSAVAITSGDGGGVNFDNVSGDLNVSSDYYDFLPQGSTTTIEYSITAKSDHGSGGGSSTREFSGHTITIEGKNDAPVVSDSVSSTASQNDSAFSVDLLNHASDVDLGAILSVDNLSLVSGDDSGISVSGNSLSVDPSAYTYLGDGESMTVEYSYHVHDEYDAYVSQTASITIEGANDAPEVSGPVSASALESDAAFLVNLLDGASDVDQNDVLSVANLALLSGDDSGISLSGNSLSVDPSAYAALNDGESAVIQYSYDIVDLNGASVSQTASIIINGEGSTGGDGGSDGSGGGTGDGGDSTGGAGGGDDGSAGSGTGDGSSPTAGGAGGDGDSTAGGAAGDGSSSTGDLIDPVTGL